MTLVQLQSIKKIGLRSLFISLLFFGFSLTAQAQVYGESLDLTITPPNPGPGAHITLTVKDVVDNLDKKQVTWSLNGKVVKQGIGAKKFEFDLGELGSVSSVTVRTDVLSKTIKIRPTDIDIIWETDGYAPPFYKGKVMRVSQGSLRLVAIPNFINSEDQLIDRNKMVYTWRNSDILNAAGSGYGKNSLTYPGSLISRALKMGVEAATIDGVYKGGKEITVDTYEPSIFLYEDHPLYGVQYNRALNSSEFALKNKELRVAAVPLHFSTQDKNDSKLKYSWIINGNPSTDPKFKDMVVLRQEGDKTGISNVSVQLDNKKEFIQSAIAGFRVKFGQ